MSQPIDSTNVFCRRCGRALWSARAKQKGIGSGCQRIENRERQVKPYIQEVPFAVTGNKNWQQTTLGDSNQ